MKRYNLRSQSNGNDNERRESGKKGGNELR